MELTKSFVNHCRNIAALRDFLCQAMDQVDEKDAEIAALKKAQSLRKFPEEKPEWGKEVLVIDDAGDFHIVRFSHDFKLVSWGKMNTCESNCVLYWMPLPEKPKDDKLKEAK